MKGHGMKALSYPSSGRSSPAGFTLIELLMVLVLKALGPKAASQLTQFRSVLQAHGQDVDKHPAVDWAWSSIEKDSDS